MEYWQWKLVPYIIRHYTQYRGLPQTMRRLHKIHKTGYWCWMTQSSQLCSLRKGQEVIFMTAPVSGWEVFFGWKHQGRRTHTEHPSLSELSRCVRIQGDWGENTELPRKKGPEICTGPPIVFGWTSSCISVQRDSPPPHPRLNIKWEGSCKLNNLGDHIGLEGFWPTQLEDWLVEHLGYSE